MSDLTPQARAFLDAHRHDGEPAEGDAERVHAALKASMAASGLAAGAAAGSWVTRLTLLKLSLLVTTVGLGVALLAWRAQRPEPPREASPAPVAVVTQSTPSAPAEPVEAAPPFMAVQAPPPTPQVAPRRPRNRQAASTPAAQLPEPANELTTAPTPPPTIEPPPPEVAAETLPPAPSLSDEVIIVGRAQALLREGKPREALTVLESWQANFSHSGMLEQEALAARVVALCESGALEEGRREAAGYASRHPTSLQLSRVERACGLPAE